LPRFDERRQQPRIIEQPIESAIPQHPLGTLELRLRPARHEPQRQLRVIPS
jgi:hypothetical protein